MAQIGLLRVPLLLLSIVAVGKTSKRVFHVILIFKIYPPTVKKGQFLPSTVKESSYYSSQFLDNASTLMRYLIQEHNTILDEITRGERTLLILDYY